MSTKKEILGKESQKGNGQRRYSLLLLALLFIGFASYGTYAYFTSSTRTQHGQLKLNGLNSSYTVDKDDIDNQNTGDGTSNTADDNQNNDKVFNEDTTGSGNGKFETVTGEDASNSTKFGEFPWVYVGNNGAVDATSNGLLASSFALTKFNGHVLAKNTEHTEFDNVVEGDVFRKTIRLAVNGSSQVPMTAKITWKNPGSDSTDNIVGGAFYRIAAQVENKAADFDLDSFSHAFDLNSSESTEIGTVKGNDFIDVELVVAVKKGVNTTSTSDVLPNLAQISRQLEISLVQETNNVLTNK